MENTEKLRESTSHLRFQGILRDDLSFTFNPGWETNYIAHRPHQYDLAESSEREENLQEIYRVELLSEKGIPILSRVPEIKNITSCEKSARASEIFEVTAYLPIHRDAHSIIFRRGTFVIFRRELSSEPPRIKIKSLKVQKNKGTVTWEVEHRKEFPLRFNVGVVLEKKRVFLLAKWREETTFSLDFTNIPGTDEANIAVLASDGLRSGFDISESFGIPEKEYQLLISQPRNDQVFAHGQPITYHGRALDIAGKGLPKKQLIWRLNKEIISRSEYTGVLTSLQTGSHILHLEWIEGDKPAYSEEVKFEVASPSKAHLRYQEIINTFLKG